MLIPEEINFKISTTDVKVEYMERSGVQVLLDVLTLKYLKTKEQYHSARIQFDLVAELRCVSMNYQESHHGDYKVFNMDESLKEHEFWTTHGYPPHPGFYQVDDSKWLSDSVEKYDPRKRLNLKHYLIVGYDSYIELLATGYSTEIVNKMGS